MSLDAWGWVVAAVAWLYAFGLHVERIIELRRRERESAEKAVDELGARRELTCRPWTLDELLVWRERLERQEREAESLATREAVLKPDGPAPPPTPDPTRADCGRCGL